jgi:hypothetical protein
MSGSVSGGDRYGAPNVPFDSAVASRRKRFSTFIPHARQKTLKSVWRSEP